MHASNVLKRQLWSGLECDSLSEHRDRNASPFEWLSKRSTVARQREGVPEEPTPSTTRRFTS